MTTVRKYVLRVDAGLTAIELYTILSKLGTIPTFVQVPEGMVIEEPLRKYFVDTGVTLTDDAVESPAPAHPEETVSDIPAKKGPRAALRKLAKKAGASR